jgi:hypothetical protein
MLTKRVRLGTVGARAPAKVQLLRIPAAVALALCFVLALPVSAMASAGYSHVVLAHRPAAYWRLGETSGTIAYDASPNRHDGYYQGAPTLGLAGAIAGDSNTSVGFDGVDDDAVWAPNSAYQGAFTVVAWILNTGSTGHPEQTFFDTRTVAGEFSFDFKLSNGNLKVDVGNGQQWFLTGPGIPFDFALGTWYQVTAVITSTQAVLYVNGDAIGSEPYPFGTGAPLLFDSAHQVYLGTGARYTGEWFMGRIDEVTVYPAPLSAHTIATLYTVGSAG